MSFNMDDYVDVAERISQFNKKHPDGSLQSEIQPVHRADGELVGWLCKAYAYRAADDTRPGMGHAFEPVPGKTPYTRDSEAMNAETSAWGRAIIALGFPTKKIASQNEIRARQEPTTAPPTADPTGGAIEKAKAAQEANKTVPPDGGDATQVLLEFGKHKGMTLVEAPKNYVEWLAGDKFEAKNDHQRRVKTAAMLLAGLAPETLADPQYPVLDDDVPFA